MSAKRLYKLMVVLLTTALVVSACGASSTEAPTITESTEAPAVTDAQSIEIGYVGILAENEGFAKIVNDLSAEFVAEHPNVTYKYENVPLADVTQKIQLRARTNNLPTAFNFDTGDALIALIQSGQALELEQPFRDAGVYDKINPAALGIASSLGSGDGFYALPLELNIEGFWYNKQLFAEYGLEVPTTWDEMMAAAEVFHANGIQPLAVAGKERWPLTRLINAYAQRKLGFDAMEKVSTGALSITDPGFLEAAQAVQDMGLKGYLGESPNTIDYGTAQDLFLQGKAAMFYMGSWALRDFNDPEKNKIGAENIGLFNVPLVKDGKGTLDDWNINVGTPTIISKAAYDNSPLVAEWIKFVFSQYGDRAMSDLGMITPFKVENMPDNIPPLTQSTLKLLDSAKNGSKWFEAYFNSEASTVAGDNIQLLVTGDISPEDFVAELAQALAKK
jgi:raffinose/stachyose/melibiose transport system substrate-binding protein